MCVCNSCKNAMSFDDLCSEGMSEYEAYLLEKHEEEIRCMEYEIEMTERYTKAKAEREALLEDLKEHEAMLRIEKGA